MYHSIFDTSTDCTRITQTATMPFLIEIQVKYLSQSSLYNIMPYHTTSNFGLIQRVNIHDSDIATKPGLISTRTWKFVAQCVNVSCMSLLSSLST